MASSSQGEPTVSPCGYSDQLELPVTREHRLTIIKSWTLLGLKIRSSPLNIPRLDSKLPVARGILSIPHYTPKVPQTGAESTNNPPVSLPILSMDLNPYFNYSRLLMSVSHPNITVIRFKLWLPLSRNQFIKKSRNRYGGCVEGEERTTFAFPPMECFLLLFSSYCSGIAYILGPGLP